MPPKTKSVSNHIFRMRRNRGFAQKQLARLLISKLVIDLETLEFEIELALPTWATMTADGVRMTRR